MKIEYLKLRFELIRLIRQWFTEHDFSEVETPCTSFYASCLEHTLHPLELKWQAEKEQSLWLITSPEYAMKKLLALGWDKIYQITHAFRNFEQIPNNWAEFTILEWYRTQASYLDILDDMESLLLYCINNLWSDYEIAPLLVEMDMSVPWQRYYVADLFEDLLKLDVSDYDVMFAKVKALNLTSAEELAPEDAFNLLWLNCIEPKLPTEQPFFVLDYPIHSAALAKANPVNPAYANRWELYIGGYELANAFQEETSVEIIKNRMQISDRKRIEAGLGPHHHDPDFLETMTNYPESAGVALGIDRLIMALIGVRDIRQIRMT